MSGDFFFSTESPHEKERSVIGTLLVDYTHMGDGKERKPPPTREGRDVAKEDNVSVALFTQFTSYHVQIRKTMAQKWHLSFHTAIEQDRQMPQRPVALSVYRGCFKDAEFIA